MKKKPKIKLAKKYYKTTEWNDSFNEAVFRGLMRDYMQVGFGRMAQIISEEWAGKDPMHGYLKALCPKCDHLFDWI